MTITYKFKYKSIDFDILPNNTSIQITSYLADPANDTKYFINETTQDVDTFILQLYKNSLPTNYYDYVEILAKKAISEKYNLSKGGQCTANNNVVTGISDTFGLLNGMWVKGDGIPTDTIIKRVIDTNSIELSNSVTATGQITMEFSSYGWDIDFTDLVYLLQNVSFIVL
jgi:hypothetical protein